MKGSRDQALGTRLAEIGVGLRSICEIQERASRSRLRARGGFWISACASELFFTSGFTFFVIKHAHWSPLLCHWTSCEGHSAGCLDAPRGGGLGPGRVRSPRHTGLRGSGRFQALGGRGHPQSCDDLRPCRQPQGHHMSLSRAGRSCLLGARDPGPSLADTAGRGGFAHRLVLSRGRLLANRAPVTHLFQNVVWLESWAAGARLEDAWPSPAAPGPSPNARAAGHGVATAQGRATQPRAAASSLRWPSRWARGQHPLLPDGPGGNTSFKTQHLPPPAAPSPPLQASRTFCETLSRPVCLGVLTTSFGEPYRVSGFTLQET